jgi:hypothetical protein
VRGRDNKADNWQWRSRAILVYTCENSNIDVGVWLDLVLTLNRLRLTKSGYGQPEQSADQAR